MQIPGDLAHKPDSDTIEILPSWNQHFFWPR